MNPAYIYFFFSSRRRHTRSLRDWSSDVCSSDLPPRDDDVLVPLLALSAGIAMPTVMAERRLLEEIGGFDRSEERRVGKEGRCGRWRAQFKIIRATVDALHDRADGSVGLRVRGGF